MGIEVNNENEGLEVEEQDLPSGESIELERHIVLIRSDAMTQTPTEAYDHELPILELVHGVDNIEIAAGKSRLVTLENFSVDDEYDRIVRRFALSQRKEAAAEVYGGNPTLLAQELGVAYRRSRGARRAKVLTASLEVDNSVDGGGAPGVAVDVTTKVTKPKATTAPAKTATKKTTKKTTRR